MLLSEIILDRKVKSEQMIRIHTIPNRYISLLSGPSRVLNTMKKLFRRGQSNEQSGEQSGIQDLYISDQSDEASRIDLE